MALGGIYETGTVTIAVDRVSVTGVGTFWSPIVEVGDWIFIGGQVGLVGAVVDDTHLTLETQWVGTLPSAAAYVIIKMSWLRYDPALTQSKVRQLLEELHAQGNFLFVEGDEPDDAMGEDGQWALKTNATPWQLWLKVDGVWVQQAPPAGIRWRGAWGSAVVYSAADGVQYLGSSYISKTSNTNQPPDINPDDWDLMAAKGATGSTGSVGPPSIVWRGAWSSATTYAINDAVSDGGSSWIAVVGNINSRPPSANWNLLAGVPNAAPFDAMAYSGMQVNGGHVVSQEFPYATNFSANSASICDSWRVAVLGAGTVSWQVSNNVGVFLTPIYLSGITSVAQPSLGTGDAYYADHFIEGYRVARLMWGTANAVPITISFSCRHFRAGTYTISIRNASVDRSYAATYTQNVADTVEFKTITMPGCPDGVWNITNGYGISVSFVVAAGTGRLAPVANAWQTGGFVGAPGQVNAIQTTSDRFRIYNVCIFPGTQAPTAAQSPLIMRPFDQELATCQRYFYKWEYDTGRWVATLQAYSSTAASGKLLDFPVEMRAAPTGAMGGAFALTNAAGSSIATIGGSVVANKFTAHAANITIGSASLVAGNATLLTTTGAAAVAFDARL